MIDSTSPSATAHYRNFDFLRLVAAGTVMFSHAFLIAYGDESREPLVMLLGTHNNLGIFAVMIFLILSGFLVSRSAELSGSLGSFLWKRALRIYPGLIVCAVFLGFVVAPLFSSLGAKAFLHSDLGRDYVVSTVLWPGHEWQIDTVSFYPDPTGWLSHVIAGTLWTVPQEILCYLLLAVMVVFSLNRLKILLPFFVMVMLVRTEPEVWNKGMLSQFLFLLPSFLAGCILWHLRDRMNGAWAVFGTVMTIITAFFGQQFMLFPLTAAYPFMYFATSRHVRLPSVARLGDISFGLYLYGWPVAQICRAYLGESSPWWSVWLLSTLLTVPIAYASWHLVEKPALALKRRRLSTPSSAH
jgi:peptidoglycan/LPS O-acetylase OafA/YrhL